MTTYYKVEERADLVRDIGTSAILSTDKKARKAYEERRLERAKINRMENELNEARDKMSSMEKKLEEILKKVG